MFRSNMARLKGTINNCNKTIILLVAVVFFMVLPSPGLALNSNFVSRTCICPQDANNTMLLSYECTTIGPLSTTWRGTAFACQGSGDQILLRHTQFALPGGTSASCNNGDIVGSSVGVVDNCYISRLNVTYNPALYGTTIMCVHNNGASETEIGRSTIPQVTTTPVPPPESVTLSTITREPNHELELLLTFAWSETTLGCSYLYTIASDCGSCPASTQSNVTICNDVEVPRTPGGRECTFRVRTDVCGNIQGVQESTLRVNLRFPDPPTVSVVPTYFEEGEPRLAGIKTEFMESAAFNITDNMDGSATSYIIEYFDEDSTRKCASDTIESSVSCVNGLCTHFFDISSSSCDRLRPISVTVSAENRLGRGAPSIPVVIREITNDFVTVTIDLMSAAVICNFRQSTSSSATKTCSIVYNQSETCEVDDTLRLSQVRQIAQDTSDSVTIGLPFVNRLSGARQSYCFVVNATNGTYTAMIRGTFNTGCDPDRLYDGQVTSSSLAEGATCDPPSNSIGTSDGYACYSGTLVGAYAVHRCLNCDYRSVRTCMADGNWNGTALQCNCPTTAESIEISLPISLGVFIPIIVILIGLLIIFIALYVSLARKKKETSARVAQLQSRVTELSSVYEELDPRASMLLSQSSIRNNNMDTTDNKAYSVPRNTPMKIVDTEIPLGENYEIMRSVTHQ